MSTSVGDERTTRAGFVRGASGGALGLGLFGGIGLDAVRLLASEEADGATPRSPNDVQRFYSHPELRPPRLTVLKAAEKSDRYLFLSPSSGPGQRGVLILDDRGEVVWFRPTTPATAMNFRTALFRGQPVLTWWEGKAELGLGRRCPCDRGLDVPRDRADAGRRGPPVRPA